MPNHKSVAVISTAIAVLAVAARLSSVAQPFPVLSWLSSSAIAVTPPDQLKSLENNFSVPSESAPLATVLEQALFAGAKNDVLPQATQLSFNSLSQSGSATTESSPSMDGLLNQAVGNWFGQIQRVSGNWNAVLPTVMVVEENESSSAPSLPPSIAELRQEFWQCAPRQGAASRVKAVNGLFQVWVKGCQIAEFPTRDGADTLSKRLSEVLAGNNLDLSKLRPIYQGQDPAAKLGNEILFVVTPELAQQLGRNADLIAIEWTNHLRVALGQPEIELAQAQTEMYGLEETKEVLRGAASWYGPYFHGRITATGEVYNQYDLTVASRTLPFDTYLKVTNQKNGKSVVVRVNDRGPYVDENLRILDLSYRAATEIGSDESGVVPIDVVILKPAPGSGLRVNQRIIMHPES
jgi:rare lipoprotein A (peptidoglycan hydrolase)